MATMWMPGLWGGEPLISGKLSETPQFHAASRQWVQPCPFASAALFTWQRASSCPRHSRR